MHFHRLSCRALGATAIAALLAACSGAGGGSSFSPSGANAPTGANAVSDLGNATAATRVDLAVVLKYRNEAALDALVEGQGDDASPFYHQFLTPAQFAQKFGPTAAAYTDTIAQLRSAGFTIGHTFANRTLVDVSAPAPLAAQYFSTEIHLVKRANGGIRYTNVRPEVIPAALTDTVLAVVGLDNLHVMHPQYVLAGPHHRAAGPTRGLAKNAKPLFGPDGGYGPQVYRVSYGFPKGMTGKGRALGVVGDADFLDSDLAAYLAYFQIKRNGPATTRVLVDGGPPPGLTGDSVETTLDVETIVSIDPATALYVYEVPGEPDLRYFTDMYAQIVSDNKVDTVNTSYSECETAFVPSFPKAADAIEKQGSALGITFHSATGDNGTTTYGCSGQVTVGTPADTPHNIAVGGTIEAVNHATGQETSEIGWNDAYGATGGGISSVFGLPMYQRDVANVIKGHRNIPDISFGASPATGESLYYGGQFDGPIGGTSLASPIFGAGLTAIDQMHHSRAGYFNQALYKQWKLNGYGSGSTLYLRDITSGSIGPLSSQSRLRPNDRHWRDDLRKLQQPAALSSTGRAHVERSAQALRSTRKFGYVRCAQSASARAFAAT